MAMVGEFVADPDVLTTPQIAATAMATSPAATTHSPVQALVRWTALSEGLSLRLGCSGGCAPPGGFVVPAIAPSKVKTYWYQRGIACITGHFWSHCQPVSH